MVRLEKNGKKKSIRAYPPLVHLLWSPTDIHLAEYELEQGNGPSPNLLSNEGTYFYKQQRYEIFGWSYSVWLYESLDPPRERVRGSLLLRWNLLPPRTGRIWNAGRTRPEGSGLPDLAGVGHVHIGKRSCTPPPWFARSLSSSLTLGANKCCHQCLKSWRSVHVRTSHQNLERQMPALREPHLLRLIVMCIVLLTAGDGLESNPWKFNHLLRYLTRWHSVKCTGSIPNIKHSNSPYFPFALPNLWLCFFSILLCWEPYFFFF